MRKKCLLNIAVGGVGAVMFSTVALQAQSWQLINANVPGAITGDNTRPMDTDGTRLYVRGTRGVYVSSDNGGSFTAINDVAGTASYTLTNLTHRFLKYENGSVWIGTDPGSAAINLGHASLHRLTPGQSVWQKSSAGFPIGDTGNQADDIAYDTSTGTYYVAAALGGAFVSTDGSNWVQRASGLGGQGVPSSVVAFNGMAFELRPLAQVYKTANQGTNWTALASHQGISSGYLLQKNGRIMFASTGNNTLQDGFNYSDNFGATWTFSTGLRGTADLTLKDGLIYAAGGFGGVVEAVYGRYAFKYSATDGITWDNLPTNGLPVDSFYGFTANRIVRQGNYLFMHSFTNLYRLDVSAVDFRPVTQFLKQPPTNNNYIVGQTLNLNALAIGTNVTYQWRFNGTNIAGATGTNFTLGPLQLTNSGVYTVVATGDRNSVTSSNITVTVVQRLEGLYDITYKNPLTGGNTYVLPDGSLVSVNGATVYKMGPDGARSITRTISGANFPASFLDSSNRVLLGGTSSGNRLIRVFASDLTDDPSFHPLTANSTISAVAELPGRGYLVGGFFTGVTNAGISTNAVNHICLIDYSGVVDTNFSIGTGPAGSSPWVTKIVVAGTTNIYLGGGWSSWNGNPLAGFVKLTPAGSLDGGFSYLAMNNAYFFQSYVSGKLFAVLLGKPAIINPNGLTDPSFNVSNRTFTQLNTVTSIAVGESNKIYVVGTGSLTAYGSTNVGKYLRLNADGTFDSSFNCTNAPVDGSGFTWITYDPHGYVYLTRDFSSSGTFQGQSFGTGPYRLFAGTNAVSTTSFGSWATQFALPPGQNNPQDDADSDGLKNVFEYYFGSNPTNAASGAPPTVISVNVSGQNYPAITFIRSQSVTGVTLIPQVSSTVGFADSLGSTTQSVVDLGNGTERVTIRSNVSLMALAAQFLRIQLSVP
jgi:hypothetical protein